MFIKMEKTMPLSPDGNTVNNYQEGETYPLSEDLAKIVIDNGWGKEVKAPKVKKDKDKGDAPENKGGGESE